MYNSLHYQHFSSLQHCDQAACRITPNNLLSLGSLNSDGLMGSHQSGGAAQLDQAGDTGLQLKGIWFYREQNPEIWNGFSRLMSDVNVWVKVWCFKAEKHFT